MTDSNSNKEVKRMHAPEKEVLKDNKHKEVEEKMRSVRTEIPPEVEMAEVSTGVEQILPSESGEKAGEESPSANRQATLKRRQAAVARRKALIASQPPAKKMVKDIKKKLVKEEKQLSREARHLKRIGAHAAYRLTLLVQRLREIHRILQKLVDMTYEGLKRLWLKVVHDIV